jgi:hypothetical protein
MWWVYFWLICSLGGPLLVFSLRLLCHALRSSGILGSGKMPKHVYSYSQPYGSINFKFGDDGLEVMFATDGHHTQIDIPFEEVSGLITALLKVPPHPLLVDRGVPATFYFPSSDSRDRFLAMVNESEEWETIGLSNIASATKEK